MLREMNLDTFVNELASVSPAPGGGSTAGLAASLGAALTSMVFNLTIDNKAGEGLAPEIIEEMKTRREEMLKLKTEFIDLVEEDTASFNRFMSALKMPKATEEEKAVRKAALDQAKVDIITTPEKIAVSAAKAWDAIELANNYGNPNAVSDAGVAALMLDAAIKAALLNVKINLPMVKDEAKKVEYVERMNGLLAESTERVNKIYSSVSKKLDA
ncbi:cyclodeaminase/cyclohydrolase family protein [Proteiniclasticum sp. QWL-01]|uniref:cyclodeaminase/cyclohydrolase family protein n=1 Tax=Proteiniclasticum sp. QWL-01 TaxID=3036945 RepID=UPI0024115BB7|nr:cyclodeaminase/cyclohydrolase family protein [Proteiniclasticum sp. QWL-01]WFF74190.1 cyclodeaminase/cyclohydrolase family protein [Proteiniclasticum sp. QWL-01]